MNYNWQSVSNFIILGIIILSLPLIVIYSQHTQQTQQNAATSATPILAAEQSMLDNIKQNGWDNNPLINNGLGGLWINWRYGSSPLQTNFNGSGNPDGSSVNPPRHDPLTDLRYIHNLWLYKSQNPGDTRYDSEVTKYTPIIKAEFANAHDAQRGWEYDEEFTDLYNLSQDSFYQSQMQNLANAYVKSIVPNVGIFFKTSPTHPQGYYRPEDALETGLGLIQAGTQFHNSSWTQTGQNIVNFVYAHAYLSQYHTFPEQLDQVLTTSGTVNPSEVFYIDNSGKSPVTGNEVRVGGTGQIIVSLLHTYQITNNKDYFNKAVDLLTPLTDANSLKIWDPVNLGYFEKITFSGQSVTNPGTISVTTGKKEVGRQMIMLWAFHLANQLGGNYQNMEQSMLSVALNKAYFASGHGVLYEMKPDWTTFTINGSAEDWVTTEAMGAELEALFAVGNSKIQPSTSPIPASPTISQSVTSTPSPNPNVANILLILCPHGLGNCGDNANPNSGGTALPLHSKRNLAITFSNTSNAPVSILKSSINYNPSSQNFQTTLSVPVAAGFYLISVKMDGYLQRQVPGIVSVKTGQTIAVPEVYLVTGDINNDGSLNILDYSQLTSCFGSKQNSSSCKFPVTTDSPGADINDDGKIDGADYNLMLREFSVQNGQ